MATSLLELSPMAARADERARARARRRRRRRRYFARRTMYTMVCVALGVHVACLLHSLRTRLLRPPLALCPPSRPAAHHPHAPAARRGAAWPPRAGCAKAAADAQAAADAAAAAKAAEEKAATKAAAEARAAAFAANAATADMAEVAEAATAEKAAEEEAAAKAADKAAVKAADKAAAAAAAAKAVDVGVGHRRSRDDRFYGASKRVCTRDCNLAILWNARYVRCAR